MKRRNLTRGASILFALTLITTSIIGGTFAKYTTSASTDETVRVAKFGVTVSTPKEGSDGYKPLFDTGYVAAGKADGTMNPKSTDNDILFINGNSDKVVAPGAGNDTGVKFTISGVPEVKVKVELFATSESNDIYLPEKSTDVLTGEELNNAEYHPIQYTLKDEDGNTVKQDITKLKDGVVIATFDPNDTALEDGVTYTLTWKWAFEDEDSSKVAATDKLDTALGNAIAKAIKDNTVASYKNLKTNIQVGVRVTQINVDTALDSSYKAADNN